MRFVLLGPPASGKGTQGKVLSQIFGIHYLSTGALLRDHLQMKTDLGIAAQPILERGGYLPDDLMCPVLAHWLNDNDDAGWVLDGFPRSLHQARFLESWLNARESRLDAAISLDAPFEILLGRIQQRVECPCCRWTGQIVDLSDSGMCPVCSAAVSPREDDAIDNFRSRHAEFRKHASPLIDYYLLQRSLISISACGSIEENTSLIILELNKLFST